jgi:hypothetical protein
MQPQSFDTGLTRRLPGTWGTPFEPNHNHQTAAFLDLRSEPLNVLRPFDVWGAYVRCLRKGGLQVRCRVLPATSHAPVRCQRRLREGLQWRGWSQGWPSSSEGEPVRVSVLCECTGRGVIKRDTLPEAVLGPYRPKGNKLDRVSVEPLSSLSTLTTCLPDGSQ